MSNLNPQYPFSTQIKRKKMLQNNLKKKIISHCFLRKTTYAWFWKSLIKGVRVFDVLRDRIFPPFFVTTRNRRIPLELSVLSIRVIVLKQTEIASKRNNRCRFTSNLLKRVQFKKTYFTIEHNYRIGHQCPGDSCTYKKYPYFIT